MQRLYDYELYIPADEDALTMAEVLDTVTGEVWSELSRSPNGRYTARKPMISSLRRTLQREHLDRLIDLSMDNDGFNAASMAVKTLAAMHLRDLEGRVNGVLDSGARVDPYTKAHLQEVAVRIEKALDADYIYNTEDISSGGGFPSFLFGQGADAQP